MQASASLIARSLVMIVSVVAIPAIAVRGIGTPTAVVQPDKKPIKGASSSRTRPGFAFGAPQGRVTPAGYEATPSAAANGDFSPRQSTNSGNAPAAVPPTSAFWTTNSDPVGSAAVGGSLAAELNEKTSTALIARDDRRLQPTQRRMRDPAARAAAPKNPVSAPRSTVEPATEVSAGRPAEVATAEFSALEDRLRELGATHYRLETWGSNGELYRFRAMVAVGARSTHNRYFEASDIVPLKAAERVVAQVERWRAGQQGLRKE